LLIWHSVSAGGRYAVRASADPLLGNGPVVSATALTAIIILPKSIAASPHN